MLDRPPQTLNLPRLMNRNPPHSVEMEMSVLGAMLINPSVIPDVIDMLGGSGSMWVPAHQTVYEAILSVYRDKGICDLLLVHDWLVQHDLLDMVGGVDGLESIAEAVPISDLVMTHAAQVREKHRLRLLIDACGRAIRDAYDSPDHAGELIARVESDVMRVTDARRDTSSVELIRDIVADSLSKATPPTPHDTEQNVLTGFSDLDSATTGFAPGDMVVLAARPSVGKTACAVSIVNHVVGADAPDGTVLLFSLEMSKSQMVQRLVSMRAGVNAHLMRRRAMGPDDWLRVSLAIGELGGSVAIDDDASLSASTMSHRVRRHVHRYRGNLRLIVLDYLQLVSGERGRSGGENRQEQVAAVSRAMKAVAREHNVPVLCLSQLNRSVEMREDRRPRMSDIRESGSIEQDADCVIMLHRDDYQKSTPQSSGSAELIMVKNRQGPTGAFKVQWIPELMQFVCPTSTGQQHEMDWSPHGPQDDAGGF